MLRMGAQVEIGAVGDALELAPVGTGEPELVLDVDGTLRVVGELLLGVLVVTQIVGVDTEVGVPGSAVVNPVLVPLLVGAGLDKELHLHLLELAGAEDEVPGGDLVPEGLTGLSNTERRLLTSAGEHVLEVHEDTLGGLGTQVVQTGLVLDRAEVSLEHHVEVTGLGPLALVATVGTVDLPQRDGVRIADPVLGGVAFLKMVSTHTLVTRQTLGQRVIEDADVAGRDPHIAGQDDRRVKADDVVTTGDHVTPPLPLDVLLKLDAEWAVIPGRPGAAVDLAAGEHESATLAKVDDVVECAGGGHSRPFLPSPHWSGHPDGVHAGSATDGSTCPGSEAIDQPTGNHAAAITTNPASGPSEMVHPGSSTRRWGTFEAIPRPAVR